MVTNRLKRNFDEREFREGGGDGRVQPNQSKTRRPWPGKIMRLRIGWQYEWAEDHSTAGVEGSNLTKDGQCSRKASHVLR